MEIIPVWFLVLSLFLPRIAILAAWFSSLLFLHTGFAAPWILKFLMAGLIPRVLILIFIATLLGVGVWFWIHLGMMILVWLASSVRVIEYKK